MEPFQNCIIIHHFSSEKYVDFKNHNPKSWKSSHELLGAEIGAIPNSIIIHHSIRIKIMLKLRTFITFVPRP